MKITMIKGSRRLLAGYTAGLSHAGIAWTWASEDKKSCLVLEDIGKPDAVFYLEPDGKMEKEWEPEQEPLSAILDTENTIPAFGETA